MHDNFSRKVIGWAMATGREDDLVIAALRMARAQRRPQAGLLHHSDRGSQYTSRVGVPQSCCLRAIRDLTVQVFWL